MRLSESVALMSDDQALSDLPDAVVSILLGSVVRRNFKEGDGVGVLSVKGTVLHHLSSFDFEIVDEVCGQVREMLPLPVVFDAMQVLSMRRIAGRLVGKALLRRSGGEKLKSVAMLKDRSSSGWWRMVLPGRHLNVDGWSFDCASAPVGFDNLLGYDTIFVQGVHCWESFYILERLKDAGKKLVYDLDDDIFSITPDNPAYHSITRDDQLASASCAKIADKVTVTTNELRARLMSLIEGIDPIVIPNAWDIEDNWVPTCLTGSPDNCRRILWSGGASHDSDWQVCNDAIMEVMNADGYDDVRLVIMGHLPSGVTEMANCPNLRSRIEFVGFRNPETYYSMIHHIRAEVGVCPLRETEFNSSKSSIKYLEYSSIGVPTVATNWPPYKGVIGKSEGLLVKNHKEWVDALKFYLDDEGERKKAVMAARKRCQEFDIKKTACQWAEILC